ncbi:hypothetical protein [Mycetocola spongiae]|uniref:hypothetical protein n=1 Tax=Mycetocola spongiae TaxID=2859226 RepID=UPI001CF46C23|nr:hypothetical protein [Mycetocola spongiae]UCR90242.1 hypothetical protein KXZ72_06200 [Mycetocola spongiae]
MNLGELGARALGGGGAALLIILLIWVLLHVLVSILWARALAPALDPLGSPLIALLLIILPGLGAAIFAGYAALRSAGRGGSAPARWRPERPLRVGMLLSFALLFCTVPFLGWAVIRLGPFPNLRLDAVPILALFICDALLLCIAGYLARARASARGSLLLSAVGSVTLGFSLTILCALTALNSIADSLNGMGPTLGQALESQGVQAREIGISIWGLRLDGGLLPLDLPLGELSLAPGPGLILAALLSAALLVCAAVDTPRRAPRPGPAPAPAPAA